MSHTVKSGRVRQDKARYFWFKKIYSITVFPLLIHIHAHADQPTDRQAHNTCE